jgi:hypothetical protein
MNYTDRSKKLMLLAAALLLPALLLAQYQVNTQVYRGGAQSYSPGAVKYSTSLMANNASYQLPSQVRYAAFKSGALPSELKMNYNAIGPLAPSGAMAYIPPAPNYRSTYAPTQGNYLGTGTRVGATPGIGSIPQPGTASWGAAPSASMGSVRYTPTMSPALAPTPVVTPGQTSFPSASPFSGIQPSSLSNSAMMGSIKYSK